MEALVVVAALAALAALAVRALWDGDSPPLEVDHAEARRLPWVRVYDCREPAEWSGLLPSPSRAVRLPLAQLVAAAKSGEIVPRRGLVLVVCRSGRRSLIAARALRAAGYDGAVSLRGGLEAGPL